MCTGRPPFRSETALAVLRQVCDEEPAPVRSLNPEGPAWLEQFIVRLMAKDPADRFQSAAEVAALLEGYLAHLRQPASVAAPVLSGTPLPVEPGQRRGMALLSFLYRPLSLLAQKARFAMTSS